MKKGRIIGAIVVTILIVIISVFLVYNKPKDSVEEVVEMSTEDIEVSVIVDNLDRPWDIKLAFDNSIYFTQRQTGLYRYNEGVEEIYLPDDLYNSGEGGMLGFDLAPDFETSREVYACFNVSTSPLNPNVVVARLTLSEVFDSVVDREDIITDIPSAVSGRHSGCRVRFDRNEENIIWVTTGDAADASNPQDPDSLGGKVLRVNTQGDGVKGNMAEPFDPRIFSYGHRNIQGITLFEEYDEELGYGFTAEHGPNKDDEINPLVKGNFGWDPGTLYNESVPMTDLDKYPNAVEALWSSGDRTIAMCGIEYIESGVWEGDILLAALKDSYILRFEVTPDGNVERLEEVINDYGRIRQVYQAEDGRIFFSTDNGNDDIIGEIIFN